MSGRSVAKSKENGGLRLGGLRLEKPYVLAPMAGVSDLPFRLINRGLGCELAFVEMTSARALVYRNRKTERMLSTTPEDRPLGIQLLGKEEDYLRRALDILSGHRFDVIDFNAACPVRKIVGNGEGASLMKEPAKLAGLLRVLVESSEAPVTVKIRAGWDKDSVNALDVALRAREAGVSAIFIHGRTRAQQYSGTVDYDVIREVKEALDIPVLASGDVLSAELAKKMLEETGSDGVVVARGALGNPWIFREIEHYLNTGAALPRPSPEEISRKMREHLGLCVDYHSAENGVKDFRKHFIWYTRGLPGVKPLRERAVRAQSPEEFNGIIDLIGRGWPA